jgi:hypothetical protein
MSTATQQPTVPIILDEFEFSQEFVDESASEGALVLQHAQQLTKIEDESQYMFAAMKLKEAAAVITAKTAYMQPNIDRAYAAHKRLTSVRARILQPFEDAKAHYGSLVFNFQLEQKRALARREEEERAAALKQQEVDREAQATNLANEGRVEEGLAMLETTVTPVLPVSIATPVPKIKGIGTASEKYVGEVTNMMEFLKGIVEGKAPITLVTVDQGALDKLCVVYKEAMSFPGVKLKKKIGGSVRG